MMQLDLTPEQHEFRMMLFENYYESVGRPQWRSWSMRGITSGKCVNTAPPFAKYFGLKVVVGICNGLDHYWCEDESGNIVDPTREQFGIGPYVYEKCNL